MVRRRFLRGPAGWGGLLLAGVLGVAAVIMVKPMRGQSGAGPQNEFLWPVNVPPGYVLRLNVTNAGSQPVGVRLHFLNLNNFAPLLSGAPIQLNSLQSQFLNFPGGAHIIPMVEVQGKGKETIATSLQMFDPGGQTVFYALPPVIPSNK